jgi:hypothetical protein
MIAQIFKLDIAALVLGARFYLDNIDAGRHFACLNPTNVPYLGITVFKHTGTGGAAGAIGWQSAYFRPRILLPANTNIKLAVWGSAFNYWRTAGALTAGAIVNGHFTLPQDGPTANGSKTTSLSLLPNGSDSGARYGIDLIVYPA